MSRLWALIVLTAGSAASQTVDGSALLGRIRQHVRSSILEMPSYTCRETMERTMSASNGQIEFRELLRVDVLVAEQKELFAWPGSADFKDPAEDWIAVGAIASGDFWAQFYNIFISSSASITYVGPDSIGGESLYRFDFHVPLLDSKFVVTVGEKSARTAYGGSFWVDRNSLDVVRLETHAIDIPPDIDCNQDRISSSYGRVRMGMTDRVLPSLVELKMVSHNGITSHNTITFSRCERYTTSASISFEDKPVPPPVSAPARKRVMLPEGVGLSLKLAKPITIGESAAGDQIIAVLGNNVKAGEIRLPKGAEVLGRIRRLEQHSKPHDSHTLVALEFYAAQTPDGPVYFKARLTGPESTPARMNALNPMDRMSGTDGLDIVDDGMGTGVGRFRVNGKIPHLERGFLTIWTTQ
jgi:hypothetical protein